MNHFAISVFILFIFLHSFIKVFSQKEDNTYSCPKTLKQCICPGILSSVLVFACPATGPNAGKEYTINYEPEKKEAIMECVDFNKDMFFKAMFQAFRFPSLKTLNIFNCAAPDNITFTEILSGLNLTLLKVQFTNGWNNISLFNNLTDLVELSLQGESINFLPSDIFNNMVSLQSLILKQISLQTLPQGIFDTTTNLNYMTLENNQFVSLPNNLFAGLKQLQNLSLSGNHLTEISKGIFNNLTSLKSLNIAHNMLTKITQSAFSNLTSLQTLDLSYNELKSIPSRLFRTNNKLVELYISNNGNLSSLPEELFQGLSYLEQLNLDYNKLSEMSEKLLEPLASLRIIKLNNNALKQLPLLLFSNNTKLIEINLNVNQLTSLPSKLFGSLKYLEVLRLHNNMLSTVSRNLFRDLGALKYLDISFNKIEAIDSFAFEKCDNLTFLDMSHNKMKFNEKPFSLPVMLEVLNVSHNNITEIPQEWQPSQYLQLLNLSFNKIEAINNKQLKFASKLFTIDLQVNDIETVNFLDTQEDDKLFTSTFPAIIPYPRFHQKPIVFLDRNPMKCDCNLLPFIRYLKDLNSKDEAPFDIRANSLRCTSPKDINYLSALTSVVDENLTCNISKNCDNRCSCLIHAVSKNVTVNCTGKQLDTIAIKIPINTTQIYLDNNRISSITLIGNQNWNNITHIHLSRNRIRDVKLPIMLSKNLRLLTLDGNEMEVMPAWLIEEISQRRNLMITLGNNPWQCSCNAIQLQKLLNTSNNVVNDVRRVRCGPGHLENQQLINISPSDLCTNIKAETSAPILVMTFSIIIILLCILVLIYVVIRNKAQIKLWFFRRHMCLWLWTPDDIEAGHPL